MMLLPCHDAIILIRHIFAGTQKQESKDEELKLLKASSLGL